MVLIGALVSPLLGYITISLCIIAFCVGVLNWLGQEESTDLAGQTLREYPRPVLKINEQRELQAFNDAAIRWAYETLDIDLREYVGKKLRVALPLPDREWPRTIESGHPQEIKIDPESGGPKTGLVAMKTEDEGSTWFVEIHPTARDAEEVKRVRTFYEEVLDNLPVELALLSPEGHYLYANQALGGAREVRQWFVGKTDFDYFDKLNLSPEFALRRRSQRREVLQHSEPVTFTEQIPLADGPVYYRRMYVPIFGDAGEVQALAFYGLDVTRQKLYAEEAERGREQFSRFSRLKATLLQNLSHEFRTPISSMISAAEVISNEAEEELIEFAQIIEDNGHRLINTLENMSQLVKLEEDGIRLNPAPVDLVKVVNQVKERYEPHAERKNIYLKSKSERNGLYARADEAAIKQIVRSLVDNAIKFTEEGGVLVELFIRDEQVHIQIMDTGIGMHEEFLSRLFAPFEQESEGLSRSFQGTGIGLHLVHEMVNQMDGNIRVTTKKGEGSTFTVQLPLPFGPASDQPDVAIFALEEERARIVQHMIGRYAKVVNADHIDDVKHADVLITESREVVDQSEQVPVLYLGPGGPATAGDRPAEVMHPPFLQQRVLEAIQNVLQQV